MAINESEMMDGNYSEARKSYCMACGSVLKRYSVLVCPECLDDECDQFLELAGDEEEY